MKTLIAMLALTLLIVPVLAGIGRIRRLPPAKQIGEDGTERDAS